MRRLEQLKDIPKTDWVRYLDWFRDTLQIPVKYLARVELITPQIVDGSQIFEIRIRTPTGTSLLLTRKLVRAAGMKGAGGGRIPKNLVMTLPPAAYSHSADEIDFSSLRGKRVAIVGAGASGYDNSATALEAGAASVWVFMRRRCPSLKVENFISTLEWLKHYADLSDEDRWRTYRHVARFSAPPPDYALRRVENYENLTLISGVTIHEISGTDTPEVVIRFDAGGRPTTGGVDLAKIAALSLSTAFVCLDGVASLAYATTMKSFRRCRRVGFAPTEILLTVLSSIWPGFKSESCQTPYTSDGSSF